MAELNEVLCATNNSNVGFGSCPLTLKQVKGFFLVPNGYSLTAAEIAALQASLVADSKAASRLARIYPVHKCFPLADNSEEKTIQTFPDGSKAVTREGKYDWTWQYVIGGQNVSNALRTFNSNGSWSFIFYDENYTLVGTKGAVETSLYGIPTSFNWTNPLKINDGSNVTIYSTQVVFAPETINENIKFVQATSSLEDVVGLQDINLTLNSWNEGTGVANVTVKTDWGINLGDIYGTNELLDPASWVALNASTAGVINITTLAYVSTTKTFNLTLDTADGDFPASTQGIKLSLASISALEGAGIDGYEGANTLTLPTTA